MTVYNIPLVPRPQQFAISLAGVQYNLRVYWLVAPDAGWFLDISDVNDTPILCGVPLVTGTDLLGQYAYLGFGGVLYVYNQANIGSSPAFADLGTVALLLFEAP